MHMNSKRAVAYQLVLSLVVGCFIIQSTYAGDELSKKAQSFLNKAKEDLSEFHFNVDYWDYEKKEHLTLKLWSKTTKTKRKSGVLLDEAVALKIIEYFVHSGLIDKQSIPARGMPLSGWNVSMGTDRVSGYWHLGRSKDAFEKSKHMQAVRKLLDARTQKKWDQLLKAPKTDNQ